MPDVENVIETRAGAFSRADRRGLDIRARHPCTGTEYQIEQSIEVLTPRRPYEHTESLIQKSSADKRPGCGWGNRA